MVLQILLDHFFCHLSHCSAEIASRPKMLSSISLFQMWEFLKQITGRSSLDSPHNFTWGHGWRCANQNMHVIFTHRATHYPNLKRLTRLPYQLSNPLRHITLQYLRPIFGDLNKMVFNLKNCMASISVVHRLPP